MNTRGPRPALASAAALALAATGASAQVIDEGAIAINTNMSTCEVSLAISWSADPFRVGAINE